MNEDQSELLQLIYAATIRVEGLSPLRDYYRDDPAEWVERCGAIRDLREGLGVRVRGDWLGTDAAARQRRRRGLLALEAAGLVTLHATWGTNTTHARLTPAGRHAAEGIADGD